MGAAGAMQRGPLSAQGAQMALGAAALVPGPQQPFLAAAAFSVPFIKSTYDYLNNADSKKELSKRIGLVSVIGLPFIVNKWMYDKFFKKKVDWQKRLDAIVFRNPVLSSIDTNQSAG